MRSAFVTHDSAFATILGASPRLELVVRTAAHEGPVYVAGEDALYYTTLPQTSPGQAPGVAEVRIDRIALRGDSFPVALDAVSTLCGETRRANGMTLGTDGRLVVCEQGTMDDDARIAAIDRDTGRMDTVVDRWRGMRFNSPNDVVAKSDGSVWFTDPSYGHLQGFKPEPEVGDFVYRCDPDTATVSVVADSFVKPNGIAFSPDESVLYVTDSGANQEAGSFYPHLPHHVVAFDVHDGRHLGAPRLLAVVAPGFPDGLKTDDRGHVFVSSASGVQVFSPLGDLLGEILLPGTVNFTFGGEGRNVLFITTDDAVWAAVLETTGGPQPSSTQGE